MPETRVECVFCSASITDPNLRKVWYQEDYPDIDIGPYCGECFNQVRVCTKCQHPHKLDDGIKYFGNGRYYCDTCAADIKVCDICGQEGPIHMTHRGTKYCQSCSNTQLFECGGCKSIFKTNTNVFKKDNQLRHKFPKTFKNSGDGLCGSCWKKEHKKEEPVPIKNCKHCGKYYASTEEGCTSEFCAYCYKNFYQCALCKKKAPSVSRRYYIDKEGMERNENICTSCEHNKLIQCGSCSQLGIPSSNIKGIFQKKVNVCARCSNNNANQCRKCLKVDKLNSDGLCRSCRSHYHDNKCTCGIIKDHENLCRVCDRTRVYCYSHKPHLQFNYTEKDVLEGEKFFFGFENEVSYGNHSDEEKTRNLRRLYRNFDPTVLATKSDSSISGYGFEIVTQPMTLDYLKFMDLTKFFDDDMQESSSCGLHVHVSRDSFLSDIHMYKVINFVHSQTSFSHKIAGRQYTGYNTKMAEKPSSAVKKKRTGSRGCRINMTNRVTIEFRMFAGCVEEYVLRYRLEYLHAVWLWTQKVSIKEAKELDSFKEFVSNNVKLYPNLSQFIKTV